MKNNNTQKILDMLRGATVVHGSTDDGDGFRQQFNVDYWNPDATSEEDMPDIVLAGPQFTIFHDELAQAEINDNHFKINNISFTLA